jgi:hypothetical protein
LPTRRTPRNRNIRRRITAAAIDAWRRCDYLALHAALGLHPGHRSPLPIEITALGVSEDSDRAGVTAGALSVLPALEQQRELLAIAGWPNCKSVYEANLAEAEATAKYCRELCNGPARGGRDLKFNQRQLEHALEMREWRRRLLDGLNKVN